MKESIDPGTNDGKPTEGGGLGDIDEQRGHPGKGTGGATFKPEHSGSDAEDGRSKQSDSANSPPDPQGSI